MCIYILYVYIYNMYIYYMFIYYILYVYMLYVYILYVYYNTICIYTILIFSTLVKFYMGIDLWQCSCLERVDYISWRKTILAFTISLSLFSVHRTKGVALHPFQIKWKDFEPIVFWSPSSSIFQPDPESFEYFREAKINRINNDRKMTHS